MSIVKARPPRQCSDQLLDSTINDIDLALTRISSIDAYDRDMEQALLKLENRLNFHRMEYNRERDLRDPSKDAPEAAPSPPVYEAVEAAAPCAPSKDWDSDPWGDAVSCAPECEPVDVELADVLDGATYNKKVRVKVPRSLKKPDFTDPDTDDVDIKGQLKDEVSPVR